MPKEITFAIFIGFIIGLLITFGVFTANKAIKEQGLTKKDNVVVIPSPTPSTDISAKNFLTISDPANEKFFSEPDITISGKTSGQSAIAFLTDNDEFFVQADADGFFSQEINLSAGINVIKIVSIDSFDNQAEANLYLTYSTKIKTDAIKNENQ